MKTTMRQFVSLVRREARRKPSTVTTRFMGRERTFLAYDWGSDTYVFEKDVWKHLSEQSSVLIVQKKRLVRGAAGVIFTLTMGNHTVAALPLLAGSFWNLGRVPQAHRSEVLQNDILCANVVNGILEISQRDVSCAALARADAWLQSLGLGLDDIVMVERNDTTLDYYREMGQEWRVKPLAWTQNEMAAALAMSRKRINTPLRYYHSAKGVHFLSYTGFHALLTMVKDDFATFQSCLRELVSIYEGGSESFMRMPKFHGHHEIELFGLRRGLAEETLLPQLEKLMEGIVLKRLSTDEVYTTLLQIDGQYRASLARPQLADEKSRDFIETLYMYLTGEIYSVMGEGASPAFDDRRTALPGATFRGGRPDFHPGADERTRVLMANVEQMMSKEEVIEYANIYEIRSDADGKSDVALGEGVTREIVYKTNRSPLCTSLVEKRLAQRKPGYGSYMFARVQAFKALGASFGTYRLLMRYDAAGGREMDYYIRSRCEGEPSEDIPAHFFQKSGEFGGSEAGEDVNVLLAIAALMGDAAAQNLVLKKYIEETKDCRFGGGKEILEFAYDIQAMREMPKRVSLCSIRGCMGWPDVSYTEENLDKMFDFYLSSYAETFYRMWSRHRTTLDINAALNSFFKGFEYRTREMHWNYAVRREQFDAFNPRLRAFYNFEKKWKFVLWSLERQVRRLDALRAQFFRKVGEIALEHDENEEAMFR